MADMDRIEKALRALSDKEKTALRSILARILARDFLGLEVRKLRGYDAIYRVRKGRMRMLYRIERDGAVRILAVERRSDTTYARHF